MKICITLLFVLFTTFANAQMQKGYSIYKEFKINGNSFIEKYIHKNNSYNYCPSNFKLDKALINTDASFLTKRYEIGHVKPEPFIAFSCKWKPINVESMVLRIRFSTADNKNNNELNNGDGFQDIIPDEHYEGNDGYKVSQLMFIDKKYTHFEIIAIAKNRTSSNILNNLKLNFFNPYGIDLLNDKRAICNYSIPNFNLKAKLGEFLEYNKKKVSLINFEWESVLKLGFDEYCEEQAKQLKAINQIDYFENAKINTRTDNVTSTEHTQACPCNLPNYITRTQWNCPQGQGLVSGVGTSSNVTHLIVHHSAGANTATDWNAVVLSIWNFHTGTNGYSDIGYNWLVAPNGQLYEGRGSNSLTQNVTGAHFCGFNANTMGTCMIGTYTTVDATDAAKATLTKLLAWKSCQAGIPVSGTAFHASSGLTLNRISGHRDGCSTECPGTMVYNSLPTIRLAVQDSINACGSATPPCVPSFKIAATGCPNNSITFTPVNIINGGTAPVYTWYVNNTQLLSGNSYVLNNAVNGDKVYARMTSNATCIAATQTPVNSDTITISCIVATPIINVDGLQYCRISPNPSNGNFVVQMQLNKTTQVRYKLINLLGNTIFITNTERIQGAITKSFNNKNLPAGNYIMEISYDGKRVPYKLMVY